MVGKKTIQLLFLIFTVISYSTISNAKTNAVLDKSIQDSIYTVVSKMPEFPGGEKALLPYLFKYNQYTEDEKASKEEGKVIVQFVINKDGEVEQVKIIRSIAPKINKEAIKMVNAFPKWVPGEENGQKVSVYKTVPITFKNILIDSTNWVVNKNTVVFIDSVRMPENFDISIINSDKIIGAKILKPFPKETKEKLMKEYGKQAANGVVYITSNKYEIYYELVENSECKEDPQVPKFIGGNEQLFNLISDSLQYPFVAKQLKKEGKVFVNFNIDKTGKVSNVKVARPLDYFLDKEAIRVISISPNWLPGTLCGKEIEVKLTLPVSFKLEQQATEKLEWEVSDKTVKIFNGKRLPNSFNLGWINYGVVTNYKTLKPGTEQENKKLVKEYGKDAINGVVIIETPE